MVLLLSLPLVGVRSIGYHSQFRRLRLRWGRIYSGGGVDLCCCIFWLCPPSVGLAVPRRCSACAPSSCRSGAFIPVIFTFSRDAGFASVLMAAACFAPSRAASGRSRWVARSCHPLPFQCARGVVPVGLVVPTPASSGGVAPLPGLSFPFAHVIACASVAGLVVLVAFRPSLRMAVLPCPAGLWRCPGGFVWAVPRFRRSAPLDLCPCSFAGTCVPSYISPAVPSLDRTLCVGSVLLRLWFSLG